MRCRTGGSQENLQHWIEFESFPVSEFTWNFMACLRRNSSVLVLGFINLTSEWRATLLSEAYIHTHTPTHTPFSTGFFGFAAWMYKPPSNPNPTPNTVPSLCSENFFWSRDGSFSRLSSFLFISEKNILLFSTFWKRPFAVSFALNLVRSPALSHFLFLWAPWFFSFIIYLFMFCHFGSPPPSPFSSSILSPFSMIPTHITATAPISMLMKHRLLCCANWLTNHKRANLGMGGQDREASFIKIILWFVFDSA